MTTSPDGSPDQLDEVLERSREHGFLGPGPVAPQREHARVFVSPLQAASRVLDLGSGGGVPGLVLAWELPALEVVLLDAMAKRCDFLETAVAELGLGARVQVACGRAEELARDEQWRRSFPVVVARSFGPPAVLAECAVGFLTGPGARLLVSEPPDATASELRWPDAGLAVLGLARRRLERSHGGTVQELVMTAPPADRYPRRVGVPAKRPLF
ncbi:MAG: class I SAM-dependent methyltransferase [Actinomycetota bacterium]|nr:class I SAM-dependent methyltransferase [Actinomycetota bacterium]